LKSNYLLILDVEPLHIVPLFKRDSHLFVVLSVTKVTEGRSNSEADTRSSDRNPTSAIYRR